MSTGISEEALMHRLHSFDGFKIIDSDLEKEYIFHHEPSHERYVEYFIQQLDNSPSKFQQIHKLEGFNLYVVIKVNDKILNIYKEALFPYIEKDPVIPKMINYPQDKKYKVEVYLVLDNFKKEKKEFDKLFHLLDDTTRKVSDSYDEQYKVFSTVNGTNLLESISNFFFKNKTWIFIIYITYLIINYKVQLQVLGFPISLISTEDLTYVFQIVLALIVQLKAEVFAILMLLFGLSFMMVTPFLDNYKEHKFSNRKHKIAFLTTITLSIYFIMGTIIHEQRITFSKEHINTNNPVLQFYIATSIYPRIATDDNNSYYVVLGKEGRMYDTYPLEIILQETNKTAFNKDVNLSSSSYNATILALFKYSDYSDMKNIMHKRSIKLLDKNSSLQILKSKLENNAPNVP